jgi:hypothetical protein
MNVKTISGSYSSLGLSKYVKNKIEISLDYPFNPLKNKPPFWRDILKLAGNVNNDKNGTPLFVLFLE